MKRESGVIAILFVALFALLAGIIVGVKKPDLLNSPQVGERK